MQINRIMLNMDTWRFLYPAGTTDQAIIDRWVDVYGQAPAEITRDGGGVQAGPIPHMRRDDHQIKGLPLFDDREV